MGQEFAADYDVYRLSNVYDFGEVFLETDGGDDDESTKGPDDDATMRTCRQKRRSYSPSDPSDRGRCHNVFFYGQTT